MMVLPFELFVACLVCRKREGTANVATDFLVLEWTVRGSARRGAANWVVDRSSGGIPPY